MTILIHLKLVFSPCFKDNVSGPTRLDFKDSVYGSRSLTFHISLDQFSYTVSLFSGLSLQSIYCLCRVGKITVNRQS